jgi:hypothetical protein
MNKLDWLMVAVLLIFIGLNLQDTRLWTFPPTLCAAGLGIIGRVLYD